MVEKTDKIELPWNKHEIDFEKYEKVVVYGKGYQNTKAKEPAYFKMVIKPLSNVKVHITDYYSDGTVYESYDDSYGGAWNTIGQLIWDFDVENIVGTLKIYAYPKKSLKGIKTAVCGRKNACENVIKQLENSVRKMI